MAKAIKFKSWNDTSTSTSHFKMTTKYTDLGVPDSGKSILGFIKTKRRKVWLIL